MKINKSDIVRAYFKENGNVKPSRTIAKELHTIYPDVEAESWRGIIRRLRGCWGAANTKYTSSEYFVKPFSCIPATAEQDWTPFVLPQQYKRGLILCDIHFPYHDPVALRASMMHGIDFNPDFILINEALDCYGLSKFNKNPSNPGLQAEIDCLHEFIDEVHDQMGDVKIFYKLGNHEERIEHLLWANPAIFGLKSMQFDEMIEAKEYGITTIQDQRIVMLGQLPFVHGHEFISKGAGQVNPARSLFLKAKHICACGHHHQTSENTKPTITDDLITTWSIGCLCYLHPRYARLNDWNHGIATIDIIDDAGNFRFTNKRIHKGIVY